MEAAMQSIATDMVPEAATFVTAFAPILVTVAGIILAMWGLTWARDFFTGK